MENLNERYGTSIFNQKLLLNIFCLRKVFQNMFLNILQFNFIEYIHITVDNDEYEK